jgi:N-methylhydantoinase A
VSDVFAVDVGGTFTDIVVLDSQTGAVSISKVPTTPSDPSEGVLSAIERTGLNLGSSRIFFHGTTLGINTVLERKGAKTGLLTTRGFRDELEIARMNWPMHRLHWDRPEPLVPRVLRREIDERIAADGLVLSELDEENVRQTIEELIAEGVDSIAVCFLHAYAFPDHERRVGEIITSNYPQLDFTLSHVVTQEYREYERTATAVVDAMIKPRIARYIHQLDAVVRERGFKGELFITRSDGGVMSAAEAAAKSVRTLISGPASGIMGSVTLGRSLGARNVLAIDMGGTSFDCALVVDHEPILRSISHVEGIPLLMPMIELATIGAGGGSIAWIDAGGALEVGPQSAGAVPGPVCYRNGGTEPTFTDAALVSGLIDPAYFLGGEILLDVESARSSIDEKIAVPLGLSIDEAASGIVALTEAKMAATLEQITVGQGHDPREFVMVSYGGGGPLTAAALALRLDIPRIVIPRLPAAFSAWGMLTLDIVHDFSKTLIGKLDELDPPEVVEAFATLEADATTTLDREGVPPGARRMPKAIDMRYESQEHTLSVLLPDDWSADSNLGNLREQFENRHRAAYGYTVADPVVVVAYRIRAIGLLEKPRPHSPDDARPGSGNALKGRRSVRHRESGGEFDCPIYDRDLLTSGTVIQGPAIVEEPTSTTLVAPRQDLTVDSAGNLVITNVSQRPSDPKE